MALSDLSRDCIHDTLMYKRDRKQWNLPCSFARSLYNLSIQRLRAGQLAPYIETKLRSNRVLDLQTLKRTAPEIIIVMYAGHVKQVRSSNPFTRIQIADDESIRNDPGTYSIMCEAEELGMESDMHTIYEN